MWIPEHPVIPVGFKTQVPGGGKLPDHYNRWADPFIALTSQKIAKERGVTPTQLACAWILQAPGVTAPIIGATKAHHLKEIFDTVDIKLTAEEVAAMEAPYRPHPIVGYEHPLPRKMLR